MKTMTCKQMGGPCDVAFTADTPDEMIQLGSAHVTEMADKDSEHKKAAEMMAAAQTNPALAQEWDKKFQADFAALPTMA